MATSIHTTLMNMAPSLFLKSYSFLDLVAIDCVWNDYSEWTSCSKDCGGGMRSRTRTIKVSASNGGNDCSGPETEEEPCNTNKCAGTKLMII